jgi:RNA polymerase sigma-70 factor (ECF subfamily)
MATAQLNLHEFNETYVRGLQAQDTTIEAHFVSYFSRLLQGRLRRRLACSESIKDVQQETFLRALTAVRAKGGIRQPERFGAFVSSVCNNILRESYRTRARYRAMDDSAVDPVDQGVSPEGMLVTAEARRKVQEVLCRMPLKDQKILRAVFIDQRNKDEVCRELGVSRNYLRVLLHRAKQQFAANYKKADCMPKNTETVAAGQRDRKAPSQAQTSKLTLVSGSQISGSRFLAS